MTRPSLLFAHGARDPRWAEPFEAVAERVRARARPDCRSRLAFLELMTPDARRGRPTRSPAPAATRVDVVPLFLGAGGHVRKDLPPLVDALRAAHPGVALQLHAGDRRARRR